MKIKLFDKLLIVLGRILSVPLVTPILGIGCFYLMIIKLGINIDISVLDIITSPFFFIGLLVILTFELQNYSEISTKSYKKLEMIFKEYPELKKMLNGKKRVTIALFIDILCKYEELVKQKIVSDESV